MAETGFCFLPEALRLGVLAHLPLNTGSLRAAGHGYHTIARLLNEASAPTKKPAGTLIKVGERRSVKRGADGAESVTLNAQRSTHRFTTGRWQSGNVHHVLNNDTVKAWLELQTKGRAA